MVWFFRPDVLFNMVWFGPLIRLRSFGDACSYVSLHTIEKISPRRHGVGSPVGLDVVEEENNSRSRIGFHVGHVFWLPHLVCTNIWREIEDTREIDEARSTTTKTTLSAGGGARGPAGDKAASMATVRLARCRCGHGAVREKGDGAYGREEAEEKHSPRISALRVVLEWAIQAHLVDRRCGSGRLTERVLLGRAIQPHLVERSCGSVCITTEECLDAPLELRVRVRRHRTVGRLS
jgi:hypothetical protein